MSDSSGRGQSVRTADHANARSAVTQIADVACDGQYRIVVFGLGSYGDAIQTTALLRSLKQRFRPASLVLVHPNRLARSLLISSPDVDEVVVAPPSCYDLIRLELDQSGKVDLNVNCRYVIEYSLPAASRLADDERAFVAAAQTVQAQWLRWVMHFPFDNDQLWQQAARGGMNMYALMALTAGFTGADFEALSVTLAPEDFALRRQLPDRYIVVCNSAEPLTITRSQWTKVLAPAKAVRIVRKLKRFGVPTVLLGTSDDPPIEGVDFDWRGRSTLRQAAAILEDAVLYVGPEGGLANLARAVGTRGVVFFGSTPPEFFGFRDNINLRPKLCGGCWWTTPSYLYQCPRLLLEPECTRSIVEDEVVQAVRTLLP